MSEDNTQELMTKYFPQCPICKSEANYSVSPSYSIVQCTACKSKLMSDDFKDLNKDLTSLMLLSLPTTQGNEENIVSFEPMKNRDMPIKFWLEIAREPENITQMRYLPYLPRRPLCHSPS